MGRYFCRWLGVVTRGLVIAWNLFLGYVYYLTGENTRCYNACSVDAPGTRLEVDHYTYRSRVDEP